MSQSIGSDDGDSRPITVERFDMFSLFPLPAEAEAQALEMRKLSATKDARRVVNSLAVALLRMAIQDASLEYELLDAVRQLCFAIDKAVVTDCPHCHCANLHFHSNYCAAKKENGNVR